MMPLLRYFSVLIFLFAMHTPVQGTSLEVGISTGYPPYYYEHKGTLTGFCIETLNAVAETVGLEVHYKVYPWKRLILSAKNGSIDAIMPLFKTEKREKFLYFDGLELAPETNHFFTSVKSDISDYSSLDDLKQYRFGVVDQYSYGAVFDQFKFSKKEITRNDKHLIEMFMHHRFDIGVGNRYVIQHHAELAGIAHTIKFIDPPITKETLYLGVVKKRDQNNRAEKLAKALQAFKSSAAYRKLLDKYGITE